jgi:hypothetical protein
MRLYDMYHQGWSGRLADSPRARFYRQINQSFGLSKVHEVVNIKKTPCCQNKP